MTTKVQANAIVIQSEILGACGQVGALLGGTIAEQIAKEHPDWLHATPAKGAS